MTTPLPVIGDKVPPEEPPKKGKVIPLEEERKLRRRRKGGGPPPAVPGITREHICGAQRSPDQSDICSSNTSRLVSLPDHALVFVCTQCHTVHRNLEGMKWVEL